MTIYTIMGTNEHTEWIAKSFTCEQTANKFYRRCRDVAILTNSLAELLAFSPDPTIHTDFVRHNLSSSHINYTLHVNELVTDAFMELTLQQSKPKHQFNKELL